MVFGEIKAAGKKGFSVCSKCADYVVLSDESIIPKLTLLDQEMKQRLTSFTPTPMVYRNLVKYLLFCIHANPGPILKSNELQKTEQLVQEAGRAENNARWSCWTLGQNSLMRSLGLRNVVLPSSMATGKVRVSGRKGP